MKIIEALKQTKDLMRKVDDFVSKINKYCVDMDFETPVYKDQRAEVDSWIQGHRDCIKEVSRLRYCIMKTNVSTKIKIVIGDNEIEKSIYEWMQRRRDLCLAEMGSWSALSDKHFKDVKIQQSAGQIVEGKVRRYYDPHQKDRMLSILKSECSIIDGKLEIVNAITDLIET